MKKLFEKDGINLMLADALIDRLTPGLHVRYRPVVNLFTDYSVELGLAKSMGYRHVILHRE